MLHLAAAFCAALPVAQAPDLTVTPVPGGPHKVFQGAFTKHVDVFGVRVFGTRGAPADKVLHTATVLAEYLDNDEDGDADNPRHSPFSPRMSMANGLSRSLRNDDPRGSRRSGVSSIRWAASSSPVVMV